MRVFITHFTRSTTITMKNKEVENSMMNDKKEEIKTAGNAPSDQTESTCVIQCMAMILNVLFGMEAYVGQVLIVYHCLYPILNGYEIIKKLLDDWNAYHTKLINIYGRCFLIVFNKEKVFLIDKDDGRIFYPLWKDCRAILPKDIGYYLVREHDDWVGYISYEPEFKDKGWWHYFDEDREHYSIVDKWCSYEDLQPYNPIYSAEETLYDNK